MKVFTTLGDGIDALKLIETETPKPKAGEVLVKMTAVSLNFRDLLVVKGVEHWKPATPRIPVSDGVGEVVAVGENVSRVKLGDRVAGIFLPLWLDGKLTPEKYVSPLGGAASDGVLAEFVIFSEKSVVKIPQNLSDEESATLPVAAITAWHAVVRRSRVQRGETVLIQGTGGVSLFALQFVNALGGKPIVTSSSDQKLEKARELGAHRAINYKTFLDWDEKVLEVTDGKGVDHVIEVVGGENLNRSLNAVKLSGSISFIGLLAGLSAPINTYQFVSKNVEIHGIETGSREFFEEMNDFIEQNRITPVIDKIFEFNEVRDALKYLESGSHFGKVVVKI
ncbi:MAG TPA: NAD(P)-dependent alcohol dehydrogenase [Pyrinomonadaceae bacterium]|jgi:NADPH:quinone reductase-like Zn-dependent oxidoreductase|nr:NAD(P)-dependent alcohol dehydrogenase [Pyrinomonadaceae bacterium]